MKATSIARFISNDETDDGMARIMSGELPAETVKQKLQDWLSNATNPYDPQDILGQKIQANLYALGFGEWFAENFARYALNEPSVFAQADQGVRTHLDRIIAALKKILRRSREGSVRNKRIVCRIHRKYRRTGGTK
jgi:hypothetical protein